MSQQPTQSPSLDDLQKAANEAPRRPPGDPHASGPDPADARLNGAAWPAGDVRSSSPPRIGGPERPAPAAPTEEPAPRPRGQRGTLAATNADAPLAQLEAELRRRLEATQAARSYLATVTHLPTDRAEPAALEALRAAQERFNTLCNNIGSQVAIDALQRQAAGAFGMGITTCEQAIEAVRQQEEQDRKKQERAEAFQAWERLENQVREVLRGGDPVPTQLDRQLAAARQRCEALGMKLP